MSPMQTFPPIITSMPPDVIYLDAMKKSPTNSRPIFNLLYKALTDNINDREVFMKGIDYSYYYEEEE